MTRRQGAWSLRLLGLVLLLDLTGQVDVGELLPEPRLAVVPPLVVQVLRGDALVLELLVLPLDLGPGLGDVAANYASINDPAKWILCFAMLLGRLEVFTLLVLFSPMFWRR